MDLEKENISTGYGVQVRNGNGTHLNIHLLSLQKKP